MPKPHDAPPGVVPFHRFLESINQIQRSAPHQRAEPAPASRAPDRVELGSNAKLLPKLGDLPAPDAPIETTVRTEQVRQQIVPATGRVLDLYI